MQMSVGFHIGERNLSADLRRKRKMAIAQSKFSKALLDPSAIYSVPQDVAADNELTREQKIEVLRRWEYDEAERRVAAEEGMTDGNGELLQQIMLMLARLADGLDTDHTPPTKQGGIPRSSIPQASDKSSTSEG